VELDASGQARELLTILQRDHRMLRCSVDALAGALWIGPSGWSAVRALSAALSSCVEEHLQREASVVAMAAGSLPSGAGAFDAHRHVVSGLRLVGKYLIGPEALALPGFRQALLALSDQLREQLTAQEAELFPRLARCEATAASVWCGG